MDQYTPEEFEVRLYRRGLCTKAQAQIYVKETSQDAYSEEDFEKAYRRFDTPAMRSEPVRLRVFDEEHWKQTW